MKKPKQPPLKQYQQFVDELAQGPWSILSDKALDSIKQMIRRAMETGYWNGVVATQEQAKIQKKTRKRLDKQKAWASRKA